MPDKRLLKCAEFVTRGGISADIGTDHAYLPVYLAEQGISEKVLACDVREGPLASARETASASDCAEKISLYLSDGLDSVPDDGITDVICAGMGGELIFDIINRPDFIKERGVNLVLQPMTKPEKLRKLLCENGFEILREEAVRCGSFIYTVINAKYTGTKIFAGDVFCYMGKLSNGSADDREYLFETAGKLKSAAEGMMRSSANSKEADRLMKISEYILNYLKEGQK